MNLADAILAAPSDLGVHCTYGVVATVDPLTVTIGAAATAVSAAKLVSYEATAGDYVAVLVAGADRLVLGRALPTTADPPFTTVTYTPGGNTDADTAGAGLVTWLSPGNIAVPAWATKARTLTVLSGVYDVTGAANLYELRQVIGTDVGRTIRSRGNDLNNRIQITFLDEITLTSTGTKALTIEANRVSGTGAYRMPTDGDLISHIYFA